MILEMSRYATAAARTALAVVVFSASVFLAPVFLAPGLLDGLAYARTCTVDLDDVQLIRKEILDIVKGNIRLDAERAGAVKRKYGDALKGAPVVIDPNDFKGILSLKGKPSPALVQDLLARVQNIIASCQ
jgi:hypothetical protein